MKIKTFKFWICIILITIFATAIITDTLAEKTTVRPKKIEQSLWEYMQTAKNDELIPINILLYDVDDNLILEKLEKKIGLDVKLFQDDERFEKEISSKICDALEKALGYDVAHKTNDKSENEGQLGEKINDIQDVFQNELKFLNINAEKILENLKKDNSISIIDYTILQVRQNYQSEKNKILREEQTKKNNDFISTYVKEKDSVNFVNEYIPSIYISATKSEIIYYAQLNEVISICYDSPIHQLTPAIE